MTVILCVAVLALAVSHALTVLWLHGLSGRVDRVEIRQADRGWLDCTGHDADTLGRALSWDWRQRAGNGRWERVTRLDVIRPLPEGRSSETTDGVEWALQDDGRTLKLWIDGRWRDRQEGASYE